MTYTINKTDAQLLTLVDGTVDDTLDIRLIGKNVSGFGEAVNENFVKLLENFASASEPLRPIEGQIWYNKSDKRLMVWDPTELWKGANGTIVRDTEPVLRASGDIWIDSKEKKMYYYVGSSRYEAGKQWENTQNQTETNAETVYDTANNPKHILNLYVNGARLGIFSSESFNVLKLESGSSTVPGFDTIVKGFNANPLISGFTFDTIVSKSRTLINSEGTEHTSADFLKRTSSDTTTGKITVQNTSGISVGDPVIGDFKTDGFELQIENTAIDGNISINTNNTTGNNITVYIDAEHQYVGIATSIPERTLDVKGNMTVSGPLKLARLTTEERNALVAEAGDVIFNTDNFTFQGYNGTNWVGLSSNQIV
jgi:hypothetical protein